MAHIVDIKQAYFTIKININLFQQFLSLITKVVFFFMSLQQ